jgi:hypothetical protein
VIRFKESADFVVMHDTEPKFHKDYGYDKIWEHFKYKYDWDQASPWTSVVSNFKPLDNLKEYYEKSANIYKSR